MDRERAKREQKAATAARRCLTVRRSTDLEQLPNVGPAVAGGPSPCSGWPAPGSWWPRPLRDVRRSVPGDGECLATRACSTSIAAVRFMGGEPAKPGVLTRRRTNEMERNGRFRAGRER